jgi:glycosyltransferase involved in cell wall biosynthesis
MRIAFVIPKFASGGAEIMLTNIMESLLNKGHQVRCFYLHPPDKSFDHFPNKTYLMEKIKPEYTPVSLRFSLWRPWNLDASALYQALSDFSPHVIHSHLYEAELAVRIKLLYNTLYVSHGHDNMKQFRPFSFQSCLNKELLSNYLEFSWLLKQYNRCNNHFISISEDVDRWFRYTLPTKFHDSIVRLPNGFNFNHFNEGAYERPAETPLKICSTGNLVPKKNHVLLLLISKKLSEIGVAHHIHILGDGPLKSSLSQKAHALGVQDKVSFHGSVSDVKKYLMDSQLYIHPATYEPFGLAILEAMATALPIIALNGKGNIELVQSNRNGFLIDENNPDLFVDAILSLIENPEKMKCFAAESVTISKGYDIHTYTHSLLNCYENWLKKERIFTNV